MRGAGFRAVLAAAVVAAMAAAWIAPSAAADRKAPLADAPIGSGLDDASAPKIPWPEPTPETAPLTLMADARLFRRPDGRVVLGAVRWGPNQQSYWLAYLGTDGLAQRQVIVPLTENEFPADAIATNDGGFLLFSWIRELWLIRLDPDGRRLWSRKLDDYEISDGFSPTAAQLSDGSFLIGGSFAGPDRGRLRYRLSRIAPDGAIDWQRNYGSVGERAISWLIAFANGTAMVGASDDLFAIDLHGRTVWQRPKGLLVDLSPALDDTAIALERNRRPDDWLARPGFALIRLDRNGRSLWRRPQNLRIPHQTELRLGHTISTADSGVLLPVKRIFDLPPSIGADGIHRPEREVSTVSILRYDSRGRRVWDRTIIGVEEGGDGSDDVEVVDAAVLGNGMSLVIGHGPKGDRDDFSSWWMRALRYD